MKSTILMTIALFLISAPSPDSKTISEMSAGFLVPSGILGLMADQSEPVLESSSRQSTSTDSEPDLDKTPETL